MIITYMKAENLKFRRSLFRKLILLIPAGLILMSVIFIFIGIGMGGFPALSCVTGVCPLPAYPLLFYAIWQIKKSKSMDTGRFTVCLLT